MIAILSDIELRDAAIDAAVRLFSNRSITRYRYTSVCAVMRILEHVSIVEFYRDIYPSLADLAKETGAPLRQDINIVFKYADELIEPQNFQVIETVGKSYVIDEFLAFYDQWSAHVPVSELE